MTGIGQLVVGALMMLWASLACAEATQQRLLPACRAADRQIVDGDAARAQVGSIDGRTLLAKGQQERIALAHALAEDDSVTTLGHLWLLAHDADAEVQAAALASALVRCPHEAPSVCSAMMTFFIAEADSETSWTARTALLQAEPQAAMAAAQRAYKLEVLSLIAGRVGLPNIAQGHLRALDVLALDADPEVQQVAGMVLMELSR